MTERTYGRLVYQGVKPDQARIGGVRGQWGISARPDVAMRVKDVLRNASPDRAGIVIVSDTLDAARDIEWVLTRYPLAMDAATRELLADRCQAWRDRERAVEDVLVGKGREFELRPPARPPMDFYERGSLVPFQEQAAQLALTTGRTLCGDELGFGKSYTSILTLNSEGALPALVVCQAHLPEQWQSEVAATLPWLRTHVISKSRPFATDGTPYRTTDRLGRQPDVLVISYAKLAGWAQTLAGLVKTVIFDEVQELRHAGTEKYNAAGLLADRANRALGLSNTPVYNYGIEAYNIINVLYPGVLGTEDEFKREWCYQSSNGKWMLKDPAAFGAYLRERGLLYARSYEDIGTYDRHGKWTPLPRPRVEPVVENVDYDTGVIERAVTDAAELARLVLARGYDPTGKRFRAAGQLDAKIRQATGVAKAGPVAAYVRMLLQTKERAVLFGWHRAVYDLWLEYLADFTPVLYTGTESPKQKREAKARFCGGDSRLLVISLRSGTGLDGLQHWCEDVVFGELDWSPQVMRQGIGRVGRGLRRKNVVTAHYLVSEAGSDPLMEELLQVKRMQSEPIMTTDGDLIEQAPVDMARGSALAASVLRTLGEAPPEQVEPARPAPARLAALEHVIARPVTRDEAARLGAGNGMPPRDAPLL